MEDPAAAAGILADLGGSGCASPSTTSAPSTRRWPTSRFPVTMLKIDKEFIDRIGPDESAETTLIATIVAMAEALHITTVAEGVETKGQEDRLRELGCDAVQGYLYSRPVGPDRLPEVVVALGPPRLRLVTR